MMMMMIMIAFKGSRGVSFRGLFNDISSLYDATICE
jgi:hypothetical protein